MVTIKVFLLLNLSYFGRVFHLFTYIFARFTETAKAPKAELERPWRLQILEGLRQRQILDTREVTKFEPAIDSSSWLKTAEVKCFVSNIFTSETSSPRVQKKILVVFAQNNYYTYFIIQFTL